MTIVLTGIGDNQLAYVKVSGLYYNCSGVVLRARCGRKVV